MSLKEVPAGGLCLSVFLVVRNSLGGVLMGKIDPNAHWDQIGALDPTRIELHRKGWMLPSSHLIVHESPQSAARRIAAEQLELPELIISEPKVVSEVYSPRYFADLNDHWDVEFIFNSSSEGLNIPNRTGAFSELRMLDPTKLRRSEIARSHEDILASVGIQLGLV